MKVESLIPGRIRVRFDSFLERDRFKSALYKMDGVLEIKERADSILVIFKPYSEAGVFLNNLNPKRDKVKLDKDDILHYTAGLIKNPVVKAMYTISMLGFRRGLITFGLCSILLARYLRAKF